MTTGRQYEHELASSIDSATTDDAWVTTCGYSGNSAVDAADVAMVDGGFENLRLMLLEVKKRTVKTGNRTTVFAGSSTDENGVEELQRFVDATPDWAEQYIVIKLTQRKPFVLRAQTLLNYVTGDSAGGIICATLDVDITEGGNITVQKPPTEMWESERSAPSNGVVVATDCFLPVENSHDG
jgi:hypothetical protein